jgi:hypothetical protein
MTLWDTAVQAGRNEKDGQFFCSSHALDTQNIFYEILEDL